MSPGKQICLQLRTTALNQQAKKGVTLLVDVIHQGYLGDTATYGVQGGLCLEP